MLYFNHGGGDVVVKKEEENEKIWIYFKGEGVKSGKIDVSLLGEKPVSVMGQLSQKGKSKVVNEIYSITPLKETIIENEFAGIKLLKPIKLHVEYDKDDEIWCIRNDELNIIGCGMSYDEALEDLKIVFESVCSEYTHCPDEQLTEDAILLKNKLLKYVGVE